MKTKTKNETKQNKQRNKQNGKGNLHLTEKWLSRNQTLCVADNHAYVQNDF